MELSADERAWADGRSGAALGLATRIVAETGRVMGARRLIAIESAHIDGCLYHGEAGLAFAERLVADGGKVRVPTTLNVGALDLLHPDRVQVDDHRRTMAGRQMAAYLALGCAPSWTCAPYQAGHRPRRGADVAWGESNAVAFANSVLGARTNRYGDLLDICAAIAGRVPEYGLHLEENRRATVRIDTSALSATLKDADVFYPVLGAWLGATVGDAVAVIEGMPAVLTEDRLKALGAAAASSGAVGLFHIAGVTPEAPTEALPETAIRVTPWEIRAARDRLSTVAEGPIDAVALGSPHFSLDEFAALEALARGRRFRVPLYICTGRDVMAELERAGKLAPLTEAGAEIVVDTCVVVAPILPAGDGVLMTNSGKFAFYTPATTGYGVVYGSLADCVASAEAGRVVRDERLWS